MRTRRTQRPSGRGLGTAVLALFLLMAPARAQAPRRYRVIVNPENPIQVVSPRFLSRAFLGIATRWPSGLSIEPVDQDLDTTVRRAFSEDVLGRSPYAVRNAWVQAIFEGSGIPPPELDSDAAVVDYVLRHRGAVGYISPEADPRGAKILEVR